MKGTTIIAVRKGGQVAIAGDGRLTSSDMVLKQKATKVRTLYGGKVISGFAGAAADALSLFDRFESYLERYGGQVRKAAIELVKEWRTDRILRRLDAQLIIADKENLLLLSGDGEIIEPDDDVVGIGSGGGYARAAAKALLKYSNLTAKEIAQASLEIAAEICIYTNREITLLYLE